MLVRPTHLIWPVTNVLTPWKEMKSLFTDYKVVLTWPRAVSRYKPEFFTGLSSLLKRNHHGGLSCDHPRSQCCFLW